MKMPLWTWLLPVLAVALLGVGLAVTVGTPLALLCAAGLIGAVIAAVHHAEVVAHRLGEPFGTLILTAAITIIEVALIVTLMLGGGADKAALPRDTIFSAIMITCNAVVGLCLVIGGLRHHEQSFHVVGANTALATLIALSTLTLVFPAFTTSSAGLTYSTAQLAFAAATSLALWGAFVFIQTVRHRDYFLPVENVTDEDSHAPPPSPHLAWASFGLLLVALIAVVSLSKVISHNLEAALGCRGSTETGAGYRHRDVGVIAGDVGGGARGTCESAANQLESIARLGALQHRADHSGGGRDLPDRRLPPGVGSGAEGVGAVGTDLPGRLHHTGLGPHPRPVGCGPLGDLRSLFVPRSGSLERETGCKASRTISRAQPFFSRFAARFSSKVFAGFFLVSFFLSIPLLMLGSR